MTEQNCYALDFAGTDYPPKVFPSLCESCKNILVSFIPLLNFKIHQIVKKRTKILF